MTVAQLAHLAELNNDAAEWARYCNPAAAPIFEEAANAAEALARDAARAADPAQITLPFPVTV